MTNAIVTETQRPRRAPQPDRVSPDELRGRSAGVTVCAAMGLAWMASALGGLNGIVAVPVLVAGVAIAAVLLRGARRIRRSATAQPVSATSGTDLGSVRRRFNLVVAGECIAIGVALNLLIHTDHRRWIPTAICAVVGLHFVPLARLFNVPLYYATAGALCLVAATTVIVGAFGGPESVWQLLPGFGAALALWITGARLLAGTT